MSSDKTILLQTYDTLPEAQYVKDALEQNGVQCFIANEIGAQLYPLFSSSVSGYRIIILEADMEKAEDILAGLREN